MDKTSDSSPYRVLDLGLSPLGLLQSDLDDSAGQASQPASLASQANTTLTCNPCSMA